MGNAQSTLELVYELRSGAMNEIADEMSTALGDVGAEKATEAIAKQMQKLLASDVLYASVVRPEINRVLADNGIEGDDVPEERLPSRGTNGSKKATVSSALGPVSGATRGETPGVHGLGLLGTSINGTALVPELEHRRRGRRNPGSRSRSPEPGRIDRERRHRLGDRQRRRARSQERSTASAPQRNRRPS